MKVLLVDPSTDMRTLESSCLNKLGIDAVTEVADAREAMAELDRQSFDLVLVDCDMPAIDGLKLLTEIRRRNWATPVLITISGVERSQMAAAIRAGCSDYLVKPFSPAALRDKLEKWVGIRA